MSNASLKFNQPDECSIIVFIMYSFVGFILAQCTLLLFSLFWAHNSEPQAANGIEDSTKTLKNTLKCKCVF